MEWSVFVYNLHGNYLHQTFQNLMSNGGTYVCNMPIYSFAKLNFNYKFMSRKVENCRKITSPRFYFHPSDCKIKWKRTNTNFRTTASVVDPIFIFEKVQSTTYERKRITRLLFIDFKFKHTHRYINELIIVAVGRLENLLTNQRRICNFWIWDSNLRCLDYNKKWSNILYGKVRKKEALNLLSSYFIILLVLISAGSSELGPLIKFYNI